MAITYAQLNKYKTGKRKQSLYERNYSTCVGLFRSFRPFWSNDSNFIPLNTYYNYNDYNDFNLVMVNNANTDESFMLNHVYGFISENIEKKPARDLLKKCFLGQFYDGVNVPILIDENDEIKAVALCYNGYDQQGVIISTIVIDTDLKEQGIPLHFLNLIRNESGYNYVVVIESLSFYIESHNRKILNLRNLGVYKEQIYSYICKDNNDVIERYILVPKLNMMKVKKTPAVILANFDNMPLKGDAMYYDRF